MSLHLFVPPNLLEAQLHSIRLVQEHINRFTCALFVTWLWVEMLLLGVSALLLAPPPQTLRNQYT